MKRFTIVKQPFEGILTIKSNYFEDDRGYFSETWNFNHLEDLGFRSAMWQDNESKSKKNVLRGLHFQWHRPMGKLVRVVRGSIYDVCVDIRPNSPTYGEHIKFLLSEENRLQLWVPPGFAHGFLSLEENTVVLYKCSSVYNRDGESSINPFDKELNIDWGIAENEAIMSEKDKKAQLFKEYENDPKFV